LGNGADEAVALSVNSLGISGFQPKMIKFLFFPPLLDICVRELRCWSGKLAVAVIQIRAPV
jgi:hypothetical protein